MIIPTNLNAFTARNHQKLLEDAKTSCLKAKINIQRVPRYDLLLIKRKRIVDRRMTVAIRAPIDAADDNEPPIDAVVKSSERCAPGPGRTLLWLGRANKTGFRCIANRRQSSPQVSSNPVVNLFDTPIPNPNSDDQSYRLPFDAPFFGRID